MMTLEEGLPAELRGPTTTITRMAAGLSGAGVYRVDANGQPFVLKVAREDEPLAAWSSRLRILRLAAEAGLAPRVLHVDEARRAIVSAFVVDRSLPALFFDPRTRESALDLLGRTLRRVHALPLPADADAKDPRAMLTGVWSGREAGFALPRFARDAVRAVLDEKPPARERATVLSHNDVNPTNLAYDGEQLLLLDWDAAGANDPFYDLAAIALFLRMDEDTCRRLLAAYDGAPVSSLPARFAYSRRLVAALCGSFFVQMARQGGYTGDGNVTEEATPSLPEVYQRVRAGALSPATAEGQWAFGLALLKTITALQRRVGS